MRLNEEKTPRNKQVPAFVYRRCGVATALFGSVALVLAAATGCDGSPPPADPEPAPAPSPAPDPVTPQDAGPGVIDGGQTPDPTPTPTPTPEPTPEPPPIPTDSVRVEGQVKRFDYVADHYQDGVVVTFRNLLPPLASAPSEATTGGFTVEAVPPGSTLLVQTVYNNNYDAETMKTLQVTNSGNVGVNSFDPYVIPVDWLVGVAADCGLPVSSLGGLCANNTPCDMVGRSTLVGTLRSETSGTPLADVPKTAFSVKLNRGAEFDNAADAFVCFLEPDAANEKYKGSISPVSLANGRFVVFSLRNGAGTPDGSGTAKISVNDGAANTFPTVTFQYPASGNVALVDLYQGEIVDGPPPLVEVVDFETDILPMFANFGCIACHRTGGPGAVNTGGNFAIFDAFGQNAITADEVYNNLVGPGTTCALGSAYRVCVNEPYVDDSLLLQKPLDEFPPNHPNASFPSSNDPAYQIIRAWIAQGVPRYAVPPPPPTPVASLQSIMTTLDGIGCTTCHTYGAGGAGGLPFDGCIQALIDDGTYVAAGIDPTNANPNYKRDCVYYHLKNQAVPDDPYYADYAATAAAGRRVNVANPTHSMLLRNPYCGPDYCANDPFPEVHASVPVRIFFDLGDTPRTPPSATNQIYSWLAAGANNTSDADLLDAGPPADGGLAPDAGPADGGVP